MSDRPERGVEGLIKDFGSPKRLVAWADTLDKDAVEHNTERPWPVVGHSTLSANSLPFDLRAAADALRTLTAERGLAYTARRQIAESLVGADAEIESLRSERDRLAAEVERLREKRDEALLWLTWKHPQVDRRTSSEGVIGCARRALEPETGGRAMETREMSLEMAPRHTGDGRSAE